MSGSTDDGRRPLVRPVATRLVRPEWATRVVSPAFDSVLPDQRRELMENDPYVFLHVTRAPGDALDLGPDEDPETPEQVAEANAAAFERLLAADVFTEVRQPQLYLYRLRRGDHVQTAIVADVDLVGLDDGRIGPHERIQPHRAAMLADHIERVGVHSSPVAFAYPDDDAIDAIVEAVQQSEPLLDFEREDGLGQTVWAVPEANAAEIVARFSEEKLYIVDGHHRVSAGVEHWDRTGRRADESFILGALFPAGQLLVRPFHRRVTDLGGITPTELCDQLAAMDFGVRPIEPGEDPLPGRAGVLGMYLEGRWYELEAFRHHPSEFDTTLLQERILGPILHVDEASKGGRLDYLPGSSGLGRLEALVDAEGGVAFALHPVSMRQLMDVVDRGQTLPPKSTYFEPKVRSGVFVTPR